MSCRADFEEKWDERLEKQEKAKKAECKKHRCDAIKGHRLSCPQHHDYQDSTNVPKDLEELILASQYHVGVAARVEMARRLRAVAKRHVQHRWPANGERSWPPTCDGCREPWPCPDARALAGETE